MIAALIALIAAVSSMVLMARSQHWERLGAAQGTPGDTEDRFAAFEAAERAAAAELLAWCLFLVEVLTLGWMGLS